MRRALFLFLLIYGIWGASAEAQMTILPLGNSITQGNSAQGSYRKALWDLFQANAISVDFVGSLNQPNNCGAWPNPAFDTDHEGHWGWKVNEILDGTGPGGPWNCRVDVLGNDLSDWLTGITPDIALVHLGTNDMFASESVPGTINELGMVIDVLRVANPSIHIYLALLIPTTDNGRNTRINSLNAQIPALVTSKHTVASPVTLVDQNTGFNAAADTYDGVHPNNSGEQKMAQVWYNAVTSTLPVGFTELDIELDVNDVKLVWETAWELNNKGFEVEHWNGVKGQFENIAFVKGKGTIDAPSQYSFEAGSFPAGSHVFRLKQIDFDGKFSYSRSLHLEITENRLSEIQMFPIPAQKLLTLTFPLATEKKRNLQIYDLQGKLIDERKIDTDRYVLNVEGLIPGVYFLSIQNTQGKRVQHKFIIN